MASEEGFNMRLFPNDRTSSWYTIRGRKADYAGDHPFLAVHEADGSILIQKSALNPRCDSRETTLGTLFPVKSKSSPKAPDFRGTVLDPLDATLVFDIAAWLKPMRQGNKQFLSLCAKTSRRPSAAAEKAPAAEAEPPECQESNLNDVPPGYYEEMHAHSMPEPPATQEQGESEVELLRRILGTIVGTIEKATCAEDWTKVTKMASRARQYL